MQSSEQAAGTAHPAAHDPALVEGRGTSPDLTTGEHDEGTEHIHLPPPTIWPFTLAGGVTIAFLGLVTSFPVSILGLIISVYAVVHWVQELRHEHH